MSAEEDHHFTCGNCHESVPAANRMVHELQCDRHGRQPLPRTPTAQEGPRPDSSVEPNPADRASSTEGGVVCAVGAGGVSSLKTPTPASAVCEFCDVEFPLVVLSEHVLVCSARTDLCDACGCYVRLRDMADHCHSGCTHGATTSTVPNASAETAPLLAPPPQGGQSLRLSDRGELRRRAVAVIEGDDGSRWVPVAVAAVGAIAATAFFSSIRRRR